MPDRRPAVADATRTLRLPVRRADHRGNLDRMTDWAVREIKSDLAAEGLVTVGPIRVTWDADAGDDTYALAVVTVRALPQADLDAGACPRCGGPRKIEPAYGWPQGRLRCRACT